MSEFLITSSLDPIEENDVFSKGLPRHVTIWQYFQLSDSRYGDFLADAGEAIAGFSPLEILGGQLAEFGPNNDVAVRRIMALGGGATLITLHTALGGVLERHEATIANPEWTYQNYNPHVTFINGRALDEAEPARLTTVELIEKRPSLRDKIVRKVWHLDEVDG